MQAAKRGRPVTSCMTVRSQRHVGVVPKEILCIFTPPTGKCKYHEEELHKVSDNCGEALLYIKANTKDDHIRVSLSSFHERGDAHAQEKWYHISCLQDARGTCSSDTDTESAQNNLMRTLSDIQIIMHVKASLFDEDRY